MNGQLLSTLDLFEREFVLFTGSDCNPDAIRASLPIPRHYPLTCYRLGHDVTDVNNHFQLRYGISDQGAVLVRPDGHVAWRK